MQNKKIANNNPSPATEAPLTRNKLKTIALSKSYKNRKVISDISIEIQTGEVIGLLGPNGAGKSTSFYIITGLLKTDSGQIIIDDQDITHLPIDKRSKLGIGYLPQDSSIFRNLNVENNIKAILQLQKFSKSKQEYKFNQLVEELNIGHILKLSGKALSGGERRRVEIARCLAFEPKFVLLDEPFAGIDPISVQEIQKLIKHLKKSNIGVLITDHNVRETLQICDKTYVLIDGTIVVSGNSKEILNNDQVKKYYLGDSFYEKLN